MNLGATSRRLKKGQMQGATEVRAKAYTSYAAQADRPPIQLTGRSRWPFFRRLLAVPSPARPMMLIVRFRLALNFIGRSNFIVNDLMNLWVL